jgi:VanZ family protein
LNIRLVTIFFAAFMLIVVALANTGLVYKAFPFVNVIPGQDKTGHFILMGIMAFLANLSLCGRSVECWRVRLYLGSIIVLICVVAEESSQLFMATRAFDLGDLAADLFGILILGNIGGRMGQK